MLDTLNLYTDKWKLEVNVNKTKMVVFINGSKIKFKYYEKCFYNDVELDIVDAFTYLGVDFKFKGKFDCTQNSIATKAIKCTFNGCEVWGFHKAPHVQNF